MIGRSIEQGERTPEDIKSIVPFPQRVLVGSTPDDQTFFLQPLRLSVHSIRRNPDV